MASHVYSNKFDPSLKLYCDQDRYLNLAVGSIADFTDNRIIYDVQMAIQKIAPDVLLEVGTTVHSWTSVFSYDITYKLYREGVYGTTAGLKLCLEFNKNNRRNEEGKTVASDYYKVELCACNASNNWSPVPLTNKAKNLLNNEIYQKNNHGIGLHDPSSETILRVIDAMITGPRRQAFRDFVDTDKKNRMEAENTKNLIEIESMDIIPELEKISKDTYMGIPDVVTEPSSKRVIFLRGGYGGSFELVMHKDYMIFRLQPGGNNYSENEFNISFIRMLSGMLELHNIYLPTHIPYSEKETAFDMLKRIGNCYGKTRFLLGCEAWAGLDDKWKRNPNK